MMRLILPYLRKVDKPMLKKGSEEYKQLQERMRKRRFKDPEAPSEMGSGAFKIPSYMKKLMMLACIPGLGGILGMMQSDYYTSAYTMYLKATGFSLGLSSCFIGASLTGLEVLQYNPSVYAKATYLFAGGFRIAASFAQVPLGFLCIWSCNNEDWKGVFLFLLAQAINTLYCLSLSSRRLMPIWLSNLQWPWVLYCQIVALYLVYSIFSKDNHTSKMETLKREIEEQSYNPNS